jgi:hypothetical protein
VDPVPDPLLPLGLQPGKLNTRPQKRTRETDQIFLGSRARPVREADNRTATCAAVV